MYDETRETYFFRFFCIQNDKGRRMNLKYNWKWIKSDDYMEYLKSIRKKRFKKYFVKSNERSKYKF